MKIFSALLDIVLLPVDFVLLPVAVAWGIIVGPFTGEKSATRKKVEDIEEDLGL